MNEITLMLSILIGPVLIWGLVFYLSFWLARAMRHIGQHNPIVLILLIVDGIYSLLIRLTQGIKKFFNKWRTKPIQSTRCTTCGSSDTWYY